MSVEQKHKLLVISGMKEDEKGIRAHKRRTNEFIPYGFETELYCVKWFEGGEITESLVS